MTDAQLIKDLIKQGESNQLEFRETLHMEEVAKTVCGFLNAEGGIVLIGLKNDGSVTGTSGTGKKEQELKTFLLQHIIPEAPVTISTESVNKKEIILVKVWNGSKAPYVFDQDIYIRANTTTRLATPDDISKLIIERQRTELHWERQLCLGASIEDLDQLEIRNTIQALDKSGRGKIFTEKQIQEFLTYYGLFQNGGLTNAAVVLFAKEPARFLPQCRVRVTVFKESKTSDQFSYDRVLEGNLFRNIEEIFQFFEINIAVKSQFNDKKWQRNDQPFPRLALREGVLNALIHRDYANVSGSAIVAFYPNRLEITNYGALPVELKPADLAKNHLSLPRNPDIAHICFLRSWIEKIGRGTIMMIEDCEQKGFPRPTWQSRSGTTTLVFPGITITAKTGETATDAITDTVKKLVTGKFTDTVYERLIHMVGYIIANKGTKVSDLMEQFKISERSVKENLRSLAEAGIITYQGSKRSGAYTVSEDMEDKLKDEPAR